MKHYIPFVLPSSVRINRILSSLGMEVVVDWTAPCIESDINFTIHKLGSLPSATFPTCSAGELDTLGEDA